MQRIKNFFINAYYFLSSRYFLKHFALMMGSFLLLMVSLFWILGWYTLHGESIEVPDLTYQTVNEIKDYLQVRKLRYEIADSVYRTDKEPGLILEQYPKGGSRVKESRKIYLVVNRWTAPTVNLYYKDLIGRPLNHIQRKLKNLDLRLGSLKYIPGPAENTVARVMIGNRLLFKEADPSKGEKRPTDPNPVPKGSVIDFVLYEGVDAAPKTVPALPCLTYAEAEVVIKSSQFNVGTLRASDPIVDTLKAYVWKQSPEAYSVASLGTGIDLWLTKEEVPCDDAPTNGGTVDDGWGH